MPMDVLDERVKPIFWKLRENKNLEWHDLSVTFRTRLAIAGYDAFTIKALMGHRDMKTT